jgi:uncharacterized protein (UPF0264 family)
MRLLVTATDADDAREAVAGGADIVDVKNPLEGPLGAPSPGTIAGVRAAVPAGLPVSVAIGDQSLPGAAALAALGAAQSGAAYVKVGLRDVTEDEAIELLRAMSEGLAASSGVSVIAAAYADAGQLKENALPAQLLPRVASAAGIAGCLLDTAVKDGRGLFEWLSPGALMGLVSEAQDAGLVMALAGGLREGDLTSVLATGADIAGVRSAACRGGMRTARLEAGRIQRLRAACVC